MLSSKYCEKLRQLLLTQLFADCRFPLFALSAAASSALSEKPGQQRKIADVG